MEKILNNKNIYYGWIIVAAAFIIMATGWASVYNSSSLFIKPISNDLGFSRSEISATMTIRAACQMAVSLFAGKIFRKFDIKKLMRFASITLIISFFSYSKANSLSMFYLLSAITSISISLISVLPLSLILSNWFVKNRGLAIGIAFMGSGVGGMIISSLAGIWIVSFGWRITYQILALIMLIAIIPCTFFIICIHPKEMGLMPYGSDDIESEYREEDDGIMLSDALKTIRFWALSFSSIFIMIGVNGLMMNVAPYLTDIGYSIPFSANIVALTMGSLAIGKLILGKLFDNLGVRKAVTIACISTLLGLVGLIYAKYFISLVIVIIFSGVGCAFGTIANTVITVDLYGKKDYSAILGVLSAIAALGSVIGPIFSGFLYDISGSYLISFKISIVFCIAAIIIYQFIFLNPKQEVQQLQNN